MVTGGINADTKIMRPTGRRDARLPALLAVVGGIVVLGFLVNWTPGRSVVAEKADLLISGKPDGSEGFERLRAEGEAGRATASEEVIVVEQRTEPSKSPAESTDRALLKEAAKAIRAKQYDNAIGMLDQARATVQKYPEAYLILGRAFEGKKDYPGALDFYNAALDRDPWLSEAYWGVATVSEAMGDLENALGGMRSFLHSVPDPDPYRLKVAQARSAIWEWEARLGRGPWGPTKGIIPGLTPEQAAKNDRGVGLMMPIPGTEKEDGTMKFEVKNQDRFKLFTKE